jgi:tagatose kinase
MPLDLLTFGEALVEVMRTGIDQPLHTPAPFTGPYPSGAPFIFAAQAARLGLRVGAIGAVGSDAFGRCLLDQMAADGVDSRGVRVLKDHTTGVAFVSYNADGSRDFVFHARHAAAGQLSPALLDDPQIAGMFDGLKCLHIMGSSLSMHADALDLGVRMLELARSRGAMISFDPNLRPQLLSVDKARIAFRPFMEAADVLIPTETELLQLTDTTDLEHTIRDLIDRKPNCVIVITQGAEGCTVYTKAGSTHIPGFVVQEVDPTGAGDCFDAGLLTRLIAGDSAIDAARVANACGALAVTAQGPMAGAKVTAEVEQFMRSQTHAH